MVSGDKGVNSCALPLDGAQCEDEGSFAELLKLVGSSEVTGDQQRDQASVVSSLGSLLNSVGQEYSVKDLLAFLGESEDVNTCLGEASCDDCLLPEAAQKDEKKNDLALLIEELNSFFKSNKSTSPEGKALKDEESDNVAKGEDSKDGLEPQREGSALKSDLPNQQGEQVIVEGGLWAPNPQEFPSSSNLNSSASLRDKDNRKDHVFLVGKTLPERPKASEEEIKVPVETNLIQSSVAKGPKKIKEGFYVDASPKESTKEYDKPVLINPAEIDSQGSSLPEGKGVFQHQMNVRIPLRTAVGLLAQGMDRAVSILEDPKGQKRGIIQIEPPELGKVKMVVRSDHNTVSVKVSVDGPEVAQVIQQASDSLRSALERRGLMLGEFSVDVGQSGHQGDYRHHEPHATGSYLGALAGEDGGSLLEEEVLLGRLDLESGVWHWVV